MSASHEQLAHVPSRVSAPPRQSLNARQRETVERMFSEGLALLEEVGPDAFSMRTLAARVGVSPATAYTFLANKDHLFAELFWRMVATQRRAPLTGATPAARLQELVRHLATLVAGAPALAAAANKSMLSGDPEVDRLRHEVGQLWARDFREAIGPDVRVEPAVLMTLSFALTGALLQAGMGVFSYAELVGHLEQSVDVIMRGVAVDASDVGVSRITAP